MDPRFPAGLPFPVPESLVFVAFCDSRKIFQQFSRNFPGTFLQNSRKDPRNSHSLLEFSEFLLRCFCKSMPPSWQKVVHTPPVCIAIRLQSIRVRGRWNTPQLPPPPTPTESKIRRSSEANSGSIHVEMLQSQRNHIYHSDSEAELSH